MQQIVARQFAAGFFGQLLKRRPAFGQTTLQCACAHSQFPRNILYRRTLPRE